MLLPQTTAITEDTQKAFGGDGHIYSLNCGDGNMSVDLYAKFEK